MMFYKYGKIFKDETIVVINQGNGKITIKTTDPTLDRELRRRYGEQCSVRDADHYSIFQIPENRFDLRSYQRPRQVQQQPPRQNPAANLNELEVIRYFHDRRMERRARRLGLR